MSTGTATAATQIRKRDIDQVIITVRQEERLRIAQELHDTCLQGFLAVSMHLQLAAFECSDNKALKARLERLVEMAHGAVEEGRRSLEILRAPVQSPESLDRALGRIPKDFALDMAVRLQVCVRGGAFELPSAVRYEIYRVGREAIVNAYRHSGAKEIYVSIDYEPGGLRLSVRDNGCGIGSNELAAGRPGHWGLQGMRERARRIGARLQFRTAGGSGTELNLFVPRVLERDNQ